jgi:hypothetical protein
LEFKAREDLILVNDDTIPHTYFMRIGLNTYLFQIIFQTLSVDIASGEYIGVVGYVGSNIAITMPKRRDLHASVFNNSQNFTNHCFVLYERGTIVVNGGFLPKNSTIFISGYMVLSIE